jgi:hypothetical protein
MVGTMSNLNGCRSPSGVPRFRPSYFASIILSALWFPLAFSLAVVLSEPLRHLFPQPNWLDIQIGIPLSVFAVPTASAVGAVVFYFFRQARWTTNFLIVMLASLTVAIFAYWFGELGHGWVGFG